MGQICEDKLICRYLRDVVNVQQPQGTSVEDFIKMSDDWRKDFPTETCRVKYQKQEGRKRDELEDQINSAYPLCNFSLIDLLVAFLDFKKKFGTDKERSTYKRLGILDLVKRILKNRPITFYGPNDKCLLHNDIKHQGAKEFERIGTDWEFKHLHIEDYMTYDEMKLSALFTISSKSFFVNNGGRENKGNPGKWGSFQKTGVIVGMVGARMKKENFMEWQDCIVTPNQNTKENGYGTSRGNKLQHLWNKFYGGIPTWDEVNKKDSKYIRIERDTFLNTEVYKRRVGHSASILIAEASARAEATNLKAYIRVVGLGLGVWCVSKEQDEYFVEAWGETLKRSKAKNIAYVDFSWIKAKDCLGVKDGEKFHDKETVIRFTNNALHAPVPDGTLLVDSFAWDGNALPGNEYWMGLLDHTGDGATACSSGVAELHNPYINTSNVCAENLHVVAPNGKIVHISKYAKAFLLLKDI